MWDNFLAMPRVLRFMTGHALACVIFLIVSLVPNHSFAVNGRHVSQAEWWNSGVGILASFVGAIGLVVGVALLRKKRWARLLYLGFATIGLVIPYPIFGYPALGLAGAVVVAAAALYLFKARAVASYFEQGMHADVSH